MARRSAPPPPEWGALQLRTTPTAHLERRGVTARPFPPEVCDDDRPETFVTDDAFAEWLRETFVAASGPLENEDHAHLLDAHIGVLWTNAINVTKGRHVLATAEIPSIQAGGWRRARFEYQLREWFGAEPDFVLTFSAVDCALLDDRAFCALVEHELYHCAQRLKDGMPQWSKKTGKPIYTIRGHDVEEFVGVVRRYGVTSSDVRHLVDAANQRPLIDGQPIAIACGTCMARAA